MICNDSTKPSLIVGSGRHKIETEEQFNNSLLYCESLKLDGLVVIGGDDSNTNACLLAEFFKKKGSNIKVIIKYSFSSNNRSLVFLRLLMVILRMNMSKCHSVPDIFCFILL